MCRPCSRLNSDGGQIANEKITATLSQEDAPEDPRTVIASHRLAAKRKEEEEEEEATDGGNGHAFLTQSQ